MGFSTANKGFLLSDGANLVLTTGSYLDRNGVEYINGLEPDEKTQSEKGAGQSKKDLTIEAALHWLDRQRKSRE
jgi:hypothetical protein